ncbi:MAG: NAD-dependent epimerase/dehydratase family protein [Proteobacteria bacterium]|nr:NAD-dependent epimerase/dehydratase family protein [Pseudomonadota bacterium]
MDKPYGVGHVLAHTTEIWDEFRQARLFVTGGTGFIGKWLLESFLAANDAFDLRARVCVLSRDPARFGAEMPSISTHAAIEFVVGDVRSFDFPRGPFTHIVHGATDIANPALPLDTFDVTVRGTRRVLDFAQVCGVTNLLLISSGAVYGRQPPDIDQVAEDYVGAPSVLSTASAYGQGKRVSEWLSIVYGQSGMQVRIARCFALVGPYLPLDKHFAIGNFMRDALARQDIAICGDGTPLRSYLHAADLAAWLWTIMARGAPSSVFNVGSDQAISIAGIAELVARLAGSGSRINIAKAFQPGATPERYVPSIDKARRELGLNVWIPLEAAILDTIFAYRSKL